VGLIVVSLVVRLVELSLSSKVANIVCLGRKETRNTRECRISELQCVDVDVSRILLRRRSNDDPPVPSGALVQKPTFYLTIAGHSRTK
jgi:hypothetical protein